MGAEEMISVPVIIGLTIITLLFAFYMIGQFNAFLTPMYHTLNLSTVDNETYQNFSTGMTSSLTNIDTLMPFAYILTVVVIALMAFQLRSHPAFLPIMIIAMIGGVFVANTMQTIFVKFHETSPLDTVTSTDLPYSTLIMNNLPALTTVAGGILLIAFFARGATSSGGFKE